MRMVVITTDGETMLSDSEVVARNRRSELGLSKKYFFGAAVEEQKKIPRE